MREREMRIHMQYSWSTFQTENRASFYRAQAMHATFANNVR